MWHHTDLSNAYPEDPYCYTVFEMITSIVTSLESIAAEPSDFKLRFVNYVAAKNMDLFSYELAIKMV